MKFHPLARNGKDLIQSTRPTRGNPVFARDAHGIREAADIKGKQRMSKVAMEQVTIDPKVDSKIDSSKVVSQQPSREAQRLERLASKPTTQLRQKSVDTAESVKADDSDLELNSLDKFFSEF